MDMADTPSSPPLPAQDIPSSPPLPPQPFAVRKRHFTDDDNLSSDPLFSEDVSESEEQHGFKRKRVYRGPWWAHSRAARRPRATVQPADSGVWLASESSDDGILAARLQNGLGPVIDQQEDKYYEEMTDADSTLVMSQEDVNHEPKSQHLPSAESLAARIIMNCVETGDDNIDLSDMSLGQLPGAIVNPLKQLILARGLDDNNSDSFTSLTPKLRIFLSKNNLQHLPTELFELDNTTVLSLRNNLLGELPSAIGGLRKLGELNIAGNMIRWLPWELLDLIRGRQGETLRLTTHPNPLWQPVDVTYLSALPSLSFAQPEQTLQIIREAESNLTDEQRSNHDIFSRMVRNVASKWRTRDPISSSNMSPVYGASTAVRYFEINGCPVRSLDALPPPNTSQPWPIEDPAVPTSSRSKSSAPSLFELASRSFAKHYSYMATPLLSQGEFDGPVKDALVLAQQTKNRRLPSCSVCGREYMFKRAEWVEYWHCNMTPDTVPSRLLFLPFMRTACSLGCVERARAERIEDNAV